MGAAYGLWRMWIAPTRIALVNFQPVMLSHLSKANDSRFIRLDALPVEEIGRIEGYDMVLISAMGLRITEAQRARVAELADGGQPIMAIMATNPANDICSLDSTQTADLQAYLTGGGRKNFRNLLAYIRRNIDGKLVAASTPGEPIARKQHLLYHLDPQQPDAEELGFPSVAAYETFLRKLGLLRPKAAHIIVTGIMGQPFELTTALERAGHVVYHLDDLKTAIARHHVDSIRPDAVINLAHGRLGEDVTRWLARTNIPLFSPIHVQSLPEHWERNKMGLSGGYLSQTVAMPELDGAVRPFVLFAHRKNREGLVEDYAMPDRLKEFVEMVGKHITLRRKSNAEKRVAIFYFKGPGQSALAAQGMEVVPSLYNFLLRLRAEGYRVDVPASPAALERLLQTQGLVLGTYAKGRCEEFMRKGQPALITRQDYEAWAKQSLRPEKFKEVVEVSGAFPGDYLATDDGRLGVPRIQLGNVVLLPQLAAGSGDDAFKIAHGTHAAPPHAYVASYLWSRHAFRADALVHFGTHGSLEFTPDKQVALSSLDWADRLVGTTPHFYLYTIGNVGEAMMAKRRSYAAVQSYLTPPFMESGLRATQHRLDRAIQTYNALLLNTEGGTAAPKAAIERAALEVKRQTMAMGIHRALGLDSVRTRPYTEEEIGRVEHFAEELAAEKVGGPLYVLGTPYADRFLRSTALAMTTDPVAYSLLTLDKLQGRIRPDTEKHASLFTARYLTPARALVERLLDSGRTLTDAELCTLMHLTPAQLIKARADYAMMTLPVDRMAVMRQMGRSNSKKGDKKRPNAAMMAMMRTAAALGMKPPHDMGSTSKSGNAKDKRTKGKSAEVPQAALPKPLSKQDRAFAQAVAEVERALAGVSRYRTALAESPQRELSAMINALAGGYNAPSPGGDPVANPNTLPTGRNLYAINAEATPSEAAWEKGKQMVRNTIDLYRRRHHDSIPRKVSYTLWSSEFIETEGLTLAQAFYMLGVEPLRDSFGRVTDLRLIPSKELGRPRIDVVVQTSGQLRDLAASRLFLLQRAVEMAAAAKDEAYANEVATGVVESERALVEKGVSPRQAREMAARRVFGGINGNYGTGIQEMVSASGRWDNEQQIAEVYLNNMGAFYGDQKKWEEFQQHAFSAALTRTDIVVQPRQNNTWGALSLDHVFEFMGGMNLSVRNITGKDPDAYLADYRNRNHVRMQELKEGIGVESRTTLFNPNYIREQMKGGASAAAGFEELIKNTFGWEVMKPAAIDEEMWTEIFDTYVADKHQLGMRQFFESKNPAALQGMTAVLLESARKGMWKATATQVQTLAKLHTDLVRDHRAACTEQVCNNAALRQFIASKVDAPTASTYQKQIAAVHDTPGKTGTVLRKEQMSPTIPRSSISWMSGAAVGVAILALAGTVVWLVRRRRQSRS